MDGGGEMRELKFRVWDFDKKRMMSEDDFFVRHGMAHTHGESGIIIRASWKIMQYTGLKDVNGVELCEGDVFKKTNHLHWWTYVVRCYEGTSIPYGSGLFDNVSKGWGRVYTYKVKKSEGSFSRLPFIGEFEILGNIYENPELLENEI